MMKLKERLATRGEVGLTLVEMVVAIMVFAIIALSTYPLFIRSVQLVSLNNITTAATVTVNDVVQQVRGNPTCGNLKTLAATTDIFEDERGQKYKVALSLPSGCDEAKTIPFSLKATRVSDNKLLLEQKAQVLIPPRAGQFLLDE